MQRWPIRFLGFLSRTHTRLIALLKTSVVTISDDVVCLFSTSAMVIFLGKPLRWTAHCLLGLRKHSAQSAGTTQRSSFCSEEAITRCWSSRKSLSLSETATQTGETSQRSRNFQRTTRSRYAAKESFSSPLIPHLKTVEKPNVWATHCKRTKSTCLGHLRVVTDACT